MNLLLLISFFFIFGLVVLYIFLLVSKLDKDLLQCRLTETVLFNGQLGTSYYSAKNGPI